MSLVALVVSHRTASPSDVAALGGPTCRARGAFLSDLLTIEGADEAVLLSTCNRVELYLWTESPEQTVAEARQLLEQRHRLPAGWTEQRSRVLVDAEALHHLFAVTAGLDSMLPGEGEIQGQVRQAYRAAVEQETVGPRLHAVFGRALEAGRKARAGTDLRDFRRSLADAGVDALASVLGDLRGQRVLVAGAGKMGQLAARTLLARGALVEGFVRRPEAVGGVWQDEAVPAHPLGELPTAMREAAAVVFATGAPHVLLTAARAGDVLEHRGGQCLAVLDLGMPLNVESSVGALPGIELFDLARLDREGFTRDGMLQAALDEARVIVKAEADRCERWLRCRAGDELAARLHALAVDVAEQEIARVLPRLEALDARDQEAVAAAVRRAVRKLLHRPIVLGKEAAAEGADDAVRWTLWLFGLEAESQEMAIRSKA